MWNPPIELTPEEQKIAQRTQRRESSCARARRHEPLDATFQETLAKTYSPEPGGTAPVEAGVLALALLQAHCNVGDRDAVELTVMDKRWQMVLDCPARSSRPSARAL
jgi:transposase